MCLFFEYITLNLCTLSVTLCESNTSLYDLSNVLSTSNILSCILEYMSPLIFAIVSVSSFSVETLSKSLNILEYVGIVLLISSKLLPNCEFFSPLNITVYGIRTIIISYVFVSCSVLLIFATHEADCDVTSPENLPKPFSDLGLNTSLYTSLLTLLPIEKLEVTIAVPFIEFASIIGLLSGSRSRYILLILTVPLTFIVPPLTTLILSGNLTVPSNLISIPAKLASLFNVFILLLGILPALTVESNEWNIPVELASILNVPLLIIVFLP